MSASLRWLIAVISTVLAFVASFVIMRLVVWQWIHTDDANRYVFATTAGMVVASAVLAATASWAERERRRSKEPAAREARIENQFNGKITGNVAPHGRIYVNPDKKAKKK
ncbi:hypothetical protein [Streptacidiphilus sp. EB103A]|uniref:hypothetical protein n=1 Tax=Streptacidiphilus sp. EB103A TaxID=3156275 RepID=UPI0035164691